MNAIQRRITEADILPPAEYAARRAELRKSLIAVKKNRRMGVGPFATFHFENYDTMWQQVHEMLHIEKGGDNATTRWWVDHALAEQVPFQILGQSCYTEFQGTPESWQANFNDLVTRYPTLNFVLQEYSTETRQANDIPP